jgi:hypothetical protein
MRQAGHKPGQTEIKGGLSMYATMTDFWADRAQWMRDAFNKHYIGGSRDQFANHLASDGLPPVCFSDKIIDLCKDGDFLAAAKLANADGWM